MEDSVKNALTSLVVESMRCVDYDSKSSWTRRARAFLAVNFGSAAKDVLAAVDVKGDGVQTTFDNTVGTARGFLAREAKGSTPVKAARDDATSATAPALSDNRRVFVVHGHDNEAKLGMARFLEALGLEPVLLGEKPGAGATIIESLEAHSQDVTFAVVLLTPDDVGAAAATPSELKRRARQNVVLELGYFVGRLSRERVCALHKGGVEVPSDYHGVRYVELDGGGAWKLKLAQELVQANLPIDLKGLVKT
jgi:predicted nucleotide-binding protein